MAEAKSKRKIFDNRYEVISPVGRGSASVVYHARHLEKPDTEVALKVLTNQKGTHPTAELLRKEALAMVSSRHRYVIRLDDFHSLDKICYLSMEYAREGDLRRFVKNRGGKLSHKHAQLFFLQTAEALDFIHNKARITHRDIKPENLLIIDKDNIRIGDFGVALLAGESFSLKELERGVGTMDYMAPEVLQGEGCDTKSDIYSLGVTFYEILTGKHPFADVSLAQQIEVRQDGNRTDIKSLAPETPDYLVEIVERCLKFDPQERFPTAAGILQAFEQNDVVLPSPQQKAPASKKKTQKSIPKPVRPTPEQVAAQRKKTMKPGAQNVVGEVTTPPKNPPKIKSEKEGLKLKGSPVKPTLKKKEKTPGQKPPQKKQQDQKAPLKQKEQSKSPQVVPFRAGNKEESVSQQKENAPKIQQPQQPKQKPVPPVSQQVQEKRPSVMQPKAPEIAAKIATSPKQEPKKEEAPHTPEQIIEKQVAPSQMEETIEQPKQISPEAPKAITPTASQTKPPIEQTAQRNKERQPKPMPEHLQPQSQPMSSPVADPLQYSPERKDPPTSPSSPSLTQRSTSGSTKRVLSSRKRTKASRKNLNIAVGIGICLLLYFIGPALFGGSSEQAPIEEEVAYETETLNIQESAPPKKFVVKETQTEEREAETREEAQQRPEPETLATEQAPTASDQEEVAEQEIPVQQFTVRNFTLPSVTSDRLLFPYLAGGLYTGTLKSSFLGKDIPLTILSLEKRGELIVTLGIPGSIPSRISLDTSNPQETIRIAANGFMFELSAKVRGDSFVGTFENIITGEQGKWELYPVRS